MSSILGDITGLFGGDSSSATVNLNVNGLNNIGETITLEPVTLNENIDLQPVTATIDLQPVTLNENIDLQPVTLNENIDLKPVAVDSCQTLRLAPLPETRVSSPYHHRVTYNLFGLELMNICYTGESGQNIESPRHPQVVEPPAWGPGHRDDPPVITGESPGIRVRVLRPGEE
jgi:hypothetical protein